MKYRLATDAEKTAYSGLYPLHAFITYLGKEFALEDLRGSWGGEDPTWELMAPDGFHLHDGCHSRLGWSVTDIEDQLSYESLTPCTEWC